MHKMAALETLMGKVIRCRGGSSQFSGDGKSAKCTILSAAEKMSSDKQSTVGQVGNYMMYVIRKYLNHLKHIVITRHTNIHMHKYTPSGSSYH